MKHVYILGAGFSVPLGGPLFAQLLTAELAWRWRRIKFSVHWQDIIPRFHVDKSTGKRLVDRVIGKHSNAEELLEIYDWASRAARRGDDRANALLQAAIALPVGEREDDYRQKLPRVLKQVIGAECNGFIDDLEDMSPDRWTPYERWFGFVESSDTIITFNYDAAIECLAEKCGRPFDRESLCAPKDGQPTLIKFHGSVDWELKDDQVVFNRHSYFHDIDLAICTPGLMKGEAHRKGHFNMLFAAAEKAIEDAEIISIVGYSMPPTDNIARIMIWDALADGRKNKKQVNIVLGPSSGKSDAHRMKAILDPLIGSDKVINHPLYAQDFLPAVTIYAPR